MGMKTLAHRATFSSVESENCGIFPFSHFHPQQRRKSVMTSSNQTDLTITGAIAHLRSLTQLEVQADWRIWGADLSIAQVMQLDWLQQPLATRNAKGHLAWAKGSQVVWLYQQFVLPEALKVDAWGQSGQGEVLRGMSDQSAGIDQTSVAIDQLSSGMVGVGGAIGDQSTVMLDPALGIDQLSPGIVEASTTLGKESVAMSEQSVAMIDQSTAMLDQSSGRRDESASLRGGYGVVGLTLRLALGWWAEQAEIYVNGHLVQAGDLFDCSARVVLSEAVQPGEVITVALRLVSPGHDAGALVKSRLWYESAYDESDPGFVADELAVLQSYLTAFAPAELVTLDQAIAAIDWATVTDRASYDRLLATLRQNLLPFSDRLKQHTIYLVGHAHLDMAWLWPVAETWEAAERTFRSALTLQQDFPELTFCHSTPALYAWMEQHRPDLFAQIQTQVQAGCWEVVGGLWVEPELNIINAEAIARHLLYGQRYCQAKFGAINQVAWLPDSFGFCWQLPQLLKQGGINYFVTQKLRWNDTTQFPHEVFNWQAPDGTEVLGLMSALIGTGIDPLQMATYAWDWGHKTGLPHALWLPGVGDHGGGPTRDMLELARRWQISPFFPHLEFTTVLNYLQQHLPAPRSSHAGDAMNLGGNAMTRSGDAMTLGEDAMTLDEDAMNRVSTVRLPTPTWAHELYLEFHRGCYTTHADQKQANRTCEILLYQAELWASLATIATAHPYPQADLETAWKKVLFNQFHDILPGSAIPQVFVDANQDWADVETVGGEILGQSLAAIAHQIKAPTAPSPDAHLITIFNSLTWQRSDIVTLPLWAAPPEELREGLYPNLQLFDGNLQKVPLMLSSLELEGIPYWILAFPAENIPALGYRSFWLCPRSGQLPQRQETSHPSGIYCLENKFLRVEVDRHTGNLSRIFDKLHQREVLNGPGNQLQAFQDQDQYWDAWNIAPDYAQHRLPDPELINIHDLDTPVGHPLETQIVVTRQLGRSRFVQTYALAADSPLLKIHTEVDWQERHVLVKAAFPLNLDADMATYEMPAGAIQRPTKPQTDRAKAQWEVPAMQWADLSDDTYGVSLLNDCKYGYDCQPDQIRLTLLRGAEYPDRDADRGHHSFTYALYPHSGNWQAAQTVRHGYELNQPLQAKVVRPNSDGRLPPVGSLLDLGADNLVLTAFKRAEDDPNTYILRCYECHGETTPLGFKSDLGLQLGPRVDLLEREVTNDSAAILPWQIASFQVVRSPISRSD